MYACRSKYTSLVVVADGPHACFVLVSYSNVSFYAGWLVLDAVYSR
uniref:Uncharacterized protein n=1 Tax=Arundo donax TaxID=35708 RepID=A0A0A8ZT87_ARUDO